MRNAVELYASEHNGVYPGGAAACAAAQYSADAATNQLTKFSDDKGKTSDTKDVAQGIYLRSVIPPRASRRCQSATTTAKRPS